MLFDSHAHINNDSYTDEEREELIKEIENSDLGYVMDIGFDLESSLRATELAKRFSWCYAAVGIHPHDAKSMDEDVLTMIKGLAKKDKVQAIGVIGLDFHYNNSAYQHQCGRDVIQFSPSEHFTDKTADNARSKNTRQQSGDNDTYISFFVLGFRKLGSYRNKYLWYHRTDSC